LDLQDEILELEEQLREQDNADSLPDANGNKPHAFRLASRRWDLGLNGNTKRREILTKLKTSLKEYDELLLREQQILSLPRPHYHSFRSVFNYIWKEKPLREEERSYIDYRADILRLAPEYEGAWASRTVDRAVTMVPPSIKTAFSTRLSPGNDGVAAVSHSKERLAVLVKSALSSVTVAFLMVPVFLLLLVKMSPAVRAVVIMLFVWAFATALSFMRAKKHEVFAATAA